MQQTKRRSHFQLVWVLTRPKRLVASAGLAASHAAFAHKSCGGAEERGKTMTKLVCFDLDDTLIRGIHSVMLLCLLNDKEQEHAHIQRQEENGILDYMAADHLRAKLAAGLNENRIPEQILNIVKPLDNIAQTVALLHSSGINSIVITVGPKQVAKAVCEMWGFNGCYGSDYEVVDGLFTGIITRHIGDTGKVECLKDDCLCSGISPDECFAVGDGATDIPLFEYCGKSIAINASPLAAQKASASISTDNLSDLLPLIL